MLSLQFIFMVSSGVLSLILLGFSAWSIIRANNMVGASIDIAVSILVLYTVWQKLSMIQQGLLCVQSPIQNVIKWMIITAIICYLIQDIFHVLYRKGVV